MVAVICRRLLGGCCYLSEASGWLLLFVGGVWVVAVISRRSVGNMKLEITWVYVPQSFEIAIIHNCLILISGSHNIIKTKRGVMNI